MGTWSFAEPTIPAEGYETLAIAAQGGAAFALGDVTPTADGKAPGSKASEAFILKLAAASSRWRRTYSGAGEMFLASTVGPDLVYALGEEGGQHRPRAAFLLRSADNGESWQPMPAPPAGAIGCHFVAAGRGWAWTREAIFSTSDDGKTWQPAARFEEEIFSRVGLAPAIEADGTLWAAAGATIYRSSPSGKAQFRLPADRTISWLAPAPEGGVWAAARQGRGPVEVYAIDGAGKPQALAKLAASFAPRRLQVEPQAAFLSGVDVGQGSQPPRHLFYSSTDRGRTWTREDLATQARLQPLFFAGGGEVWAYAGMGRLQHREGR